MAKVKEPVIRLDTSKRFSEVRGERQPDDPHYGVHFMQDGLPFDASGLLMKDDGKKEPWQGRNADGQVITHQPLYTPEMREKVARKLARLAKGAPEPEEVDEGDEEDLKSKAAEDVNFVAWLMGEVEYEPFLLFAAAKSRYSKNYTQVAQLIEDLVYDEKVVDETVVHSSRMRVLNARRPAA